ncbi:response regulator [Dyadobacter sandarakinus]|uniref:Response regulator transcription factor n=1 Tax=Dyadobacter sandarakinus TaxID=2747268 RepID=A0ABX7I8R6_9BACT|nr:response regulator transcription factor [Dyadobacter sandarakinus]QRR01371.1 response regulator transcription factor [Dyadobacter sandarakinus]
MAFNILIYEDNRQLREGLELLITGAAGYHVPAAFPNYSNIVADVKTHNPDLILMDIDMPPQNGIEGLKQLRAAGLGNKVVMLTVFDDNEHVFEAIQAGAEGYILKKTPPAKLIEFLGDALQGGAPMTSSIAIQVLKMVSGPHRGPKQDFELSAREQDVLELLVDGYSYKLIADKLFISLDTVRSHIKRIYEKLQVNSKSEAVAKALKNR